MTGALWSDDRGRQWRIVTSPSRLKFTYPAHAALRRFVFIRDLFSCRRCPAKALFVPADYDGKDTIKTNTLVSSGYHDLLILDHILTLRAGGRSVVENLQTLCETCNRKKIREDNKATQLYRLRAAA